MEERQTKTESSSTESAPVSGTPVQSTQASQSSDSVSAPASVPKMPKVPIRPFSSAKKSNTAPEKTLASDKVSVASLSHEEHADQKEEDSKKSPAKKHIKTVTEQTRDKKAGKDPSGSKFLTIKSREKIIFAKHLAIMLDSGMPLREALEVMSGQVSSKNLQRMLAVMIRDLSDGFTLSSSLEKFPRVFKPFSISIIRVGESSGTLPSALHYQAAQLEKAKDLEGKIRGALLYPIIIFFGALGIAGYLAFYILPKLLPMFSSLNVNLPPTTKALLAISGFATKNWPILLVAIVVLVVGSIALYRVRSIKFFMHSAMLRIPVFGPLLRAIQVAFFTRILGILLSSGVQIVQAIAVTSVSASNLVYQKKLKEISERVERGEAITDELEKTPNLFPKITTGMIKVGDRTGHLAESLMNAAEFSEKEVDEGTKTLATLIEPLTLLLVGGLVGFIALSIITPIYKITEGIKQ
jgi:type II secretory pathway component PulF